MEMTLERLSERLQYLEDLEAIRDTWRDYCMRLDSADIDGLADIFTEDAVLETDGFDEFMPGLGGKYQGRKSIINDLYGRATAESSGASDSIFTTGHLSTNMQIDLRGDEARTLAYWIEALAMGSGTDSTVLFTGTYQHRFRREADRWRFSFLRIAVRYRAQVAASNFGGQSLSDVLAKPI